MGKVVYDSVVNSPGLCEKFNIFYFAEVSASTADAKSWYFYQGAKGRAEDCMKKDIKFVGVFNPSLITERDNDKRLIETIFIYIPFILKTTSFNIARAMYVDSVLYHRKNKELDNGDEG